jgi:transposase-like protein
MAAVALANGLNANMLRKWVNEARLATESPSPASRAVNEPLPTLAAPTLTPTPGFVGLRLPEPAPQADRLPNIHLEVQRGDLTIKLTWPGALASECSACLRECLR